MVYRKSRDIKTDIYIVNELQHFRLIKMDLTADVRQHGKFIFNRSKIYKGIEK